MEKVLTARRAKLTTLHDRLSASALLLDATPNEDYEQYIHALQEEYDTIDAIGEREISAAREECGGL
jgi:NADP-dependent 3-hydroxy acid dehydrogenase YdfG